MKWNINLRKRRIFYSIYNMNELGGYFPEGNKSVTARQILHDSTYMRYLK